MDTSEFEALFLGQLAIVSVDNQGLLVSIKLKHFPTANIEMSDDYRAKLEIEYEEQIAEVLRENYRDAQEQDKHIKIESDKGKFV